MKCDAEKLEGKQQNEVSKLKQSLDKANEELRTQRLQYEKEKMNLQDKFNQVRLTSDSGMTGTWASLKYDFS